MQRVSKKKCHFAEHICDARMVVIAIYLKCVIRWSVKQKKGTQKKLQFVIHLSDREDTVYVCMCARFARSFRQIKTENDQNIWLVVG